MLDSLCEIGFGSCTNMGNEIRYWPEERQASEQIETWWSAHRKDKNAWNRELLGTTIRKIVEESGHWKNAARGNPMKGYAAARKTLGE